MRIAAILLSFLALLALGPRSAEAQVAIDVDQGVARPLPIALPAFTGAAPYGADIARVVSADLERSGYFRPLNPGGFIQRDLDVSAPPRFAEWSVVGAQGLVNGRATVAADGRLQVDFRLWDVATGEQLTALQLTATPENWPRVAHKVADVVYERLTGSKGYFDTRVVFVAETGPKTKRVKRLTIMDQDGANPQYLTNGEAIVLTPRFSPGGREVTYMALQNGRSRLYLLNIETGRQETLGEFPGLVFAPRFSPDGRSVAFSVERNGNSDIHVMDLSSRRSTRLTSDPGIDTSPSFSPDGRRIVFNSDRGGAPRIYLMNADGSGQRPLSLGSGRYSTPVWGPRGDLIAFTRQTGGRFGIGVMAPDGSGERMLTDSYLDEGPSWSPNGRVIMFSRETPGGEARLWSVDVSGRNARPADFPGGASDPAWSPVLN